MFMMYATVVLLKVATCHLHMFLPVVLIFLKKFQLFCLQEAKSETDATVFQRVAVLSKNERLQKSDWITGDR